VSTKLSLLITCDCVEARRRERVPRKYDDSESNFVRTQARHAGGRPSSALGRLRPDRGQRDRTPRAESVTRAVPLSFPSVAVGQRRGTAPARQTGRGERDGPAGVSAVRRR